MPENDTRFQLGFTAISVMAGIAIIIHWFSQGDLVLSSGIFFIGLGAVYMALSYRKPPSAYLLPFGGFLVAVGALIFLSRYPGDKAPILGGVLAIGGLMLMMYFYARRKNHG